MFLNASAYNPPHTVNPWQDSKSIGGRHACGNMGIENMVGTLTRNDI